jgi:hypothetical protein
VARLNDYSGKFKPNLRHEDFSREGLLKLTKEYQRAYEMILGEWHRVMRERFSETVSLECDISQWMLSGPLVTQFISRGMNIKMGNVESYFKAMQLDPGFPITLFDIEFELVNPRYGFLIVKKCTALNQFENEGFGYELPMCHVEEPPTFLRTALQHNPKIKCRPVKLPPRKRKDEIACKWEVKLDEAEPEEPMQRVRFGIPQQAGEFGKPWSDKQLVELWSYMTEDVKTILRLIAKRPEGYLKDDLIRELGIPVEELSYRLDYMYIGLFNSPYRTKQAPVRFCKNPWQYEMDKELAQAIVKLKL